MVLALCTVFKITSSRLLTNSLLALKFTNVEPALRGSLYSGLCVFVSKSCVLKSWPFISILQLYFSGFGHEHFSYSHFLFFFYLLKES